VALVCGERQLSYCELNRRANRLAARLRRHGAGPEQLVALLFEPGIDTVIAILGVLKAGCAYLPLDASVPDNRLAFMLEDSAAPLLVTGSHAGDRLRGYRGRVVEMETGSEVNAEDEADHVDVVVSPENLAYCIYTSGTTGRPKGVLVEHRQVTRLFDATQAWFAFDASDVWTLFHSYAFDFSVWEIWGALLHGGRLVIVPRAVARAPDAFHALVAEQQVTVLNQTPSAFREFIAADGNAAANSLEGLRLVIFGGEALDTAMLAPWLTRHARLPHLVNMYGITETTVHVTYAPVEHAIANGPSRIGVPIPDLQAYVLDRAMQPVPVGVRGELYIGGDGVVRGYLGRPGLSAERFVPHPFSRVAGARLYRSGDLGRYSDDGSIEYLGRIDRQVKIRGFRIECDEIEAVLRVFPGAADAIVTAFQGAGGESALFAYIVREPGATPAVEELKAHLRAALPEYMVPATLHVLDALPLTNNGKVDERALKALGASFGSESARAMPSSDTQKVVARVWREVLGIDDIGLHDNFFDLGGHSLLVPRVHRRLKELFDTTLSIVELFRHPTVADLAAHLGGSRTGGASLDESEKRAQLRQTRRGGRVRARAGK
jgi:amino acid adenylation domain-containing protein